VIVLCNTTHQPLPRKHLIKAIELVLHHEKCCAELISIVYCGDKFIKKINRTYLQHDYATDTISFRLNEGKTIEGECYISLDTVRRNARQYKQSFLDELLRVTIHSVLHLVGYHDETQAQRKAMTEKEDHYLTLLKHTQNLR
jgi:probable rRNA maturation factor